MLKPQEHFWAFLAECLLAFLEFNDKRAVEIRGKFISKFIESMNSEKIMDLNFIYGYRRTEGIDAFVPVDGQQRLTTLWLLTLYYGKKLYNSNKNTTKLLELLSNFTYDERVLAKRFCHAIADRDNSWNFNETPSKAITDASWFNPFWRNDTTVDNMLNMRGNFKTICQ